MLEDIRFRLAGKVEGNTSIHADRVSNRSSPTLVIQFSDSNRDAKSEIISQSSLKEPMAREMEEALRSKLNLMTSKNNLIPMKYSCEEIHERLTNGWCIYCDERDSPGHQLKHKRLQIVMMDLEDASMAGIEEKESLSDSGTASQFQDTNVTQQHELIQDT